MHTYLRNSATHRKWSKSSVLESTQLKPQTEKNGKKIKNTKYNKNESRQLMSQVTPLCPPLWTGEKSQKIKQWEKTPK